MTRFRLWFGNTEQHAARVWPVEGFGDIFYLTFDQL